MNPAYYVSVVDGGRTALVLGPFETEAECRQWAYREHSEGGNPKKAKLLREVAAQLDPRSWFYGWGMVKIRDWSFRAGVLNEHIFPERKKAA